MSRTLRGLALAFALVLAFSAHANRLTPSIRSSNVTQTSGAHSISVDVPSGTTWAAISICYYNNTGPEATVRPTSVSLDGQAATFRDGSADATAGSMYSSIYTVTGFSTGSGKTLAYTFSATGTYFAANIAVEFRDGTPTFGAHGSGNNVATSTASTASLANSSGDEILSAPCSANNLGAAPTVGSGQSKLDETEDVTGGVYYSFTTETGTGSGDVQSVTGSIPAIASVVVTTASGAFDVTATVSSTTTTAYTVIGSLSGAGTVKAVSCKAGQTAPTIAEINAATCTGSSTPQASGNSSPSMAPYDFSITLTNSESPAFPIHDLWITDGTTRTAITAAYLSPPATCGENADQACQFVTLTSVAIGGVASIATLAYDAQTQNFIVGGTVTGGTSGAVGQIISDSDGGATGTLTLWISSGTFQDNEAITGALTGAATVNGTASYLYAANDVLVAPTYVMPGGASMLLSFDADGNAHYSSGSERETALNIKVYDYSAQGYAADDIDFVNNDSAPSCIGGALSLSLQFNGTMTPFDLDGYCSDFDDATLTSVVVGTLPTGLSHDGSSNVTTGIPTVIDTSGVTIRYIVADQYHALGFKDVAFTVGSGFQSPDCTSTLTTLSVCSLNYAEASSGTVSLALTPRCSNTVAADYVLATTPRGGAEIALGANVSISYSLGTCGTPTTVPSCIGLSVADCETAAALLTGITVSSVSQCPSVGGYPNGKIYAQSPAPRRRVQTPSVLSVSYCP